MESNAYWKIYRSYSMDTSVIDEYTHSVITVNGYATNHQWQVVHLNNSQSNASNNNLRHRIHVGTPSTIVNRWGSSTLRLNYPPGISLFALNNRQNKVGACGCCRSGGIHLGHCNSLKEAERVSKSTALVA